AGSGSGQIVLWSTAIEPMRGPGRTGSGRCGRRRPSAVATTSDALVDFGSVEVVMSRVPSEWAREPWGGLPRCRVEPQGNLKSTAEIDLPTVAPEPTMRLQADRRVRSAVRHRGR